MRGWARLRPFAYSLPARLRGAVASSLGGAAKLGWAGRRRGGAGSRASLGGWVVGKQEGVAAAALASLRLSPS